MELLPNWHPVFVHFTIGLLLTSAALFAVTLCLPMGSKRRADLQLVALWNLWIGFALALITAYFGWRAYNTVAHDAASHEAMTVHRNWALLTIAAFLPVVAWSGLRLRGGRPASWVFVVVVLMPAALLARTGWLGAGVVFHYGLGVQSMPDVEEHHHHHAQGESDVHEHGSADEGAGPEHEHEHEGPDAQDHTH